MPLYRVTLEVVERTDSAVGESVKERARVTVEATGELDLIAIVRAIQKTKRVRKPRAKPEA